MYCFHLKVEVSQVGKGAAYVRKVEKNGDGAQQASIISKHGEREIFVPSRWL
jgi:hypothetical protein